MMLTPNRAFWHDADTKRAGFVRGVLYRPLRRRSDACSRDHHPSDVSQPPPFRTPSTLETKFGQMAPRKSGRMHERHLIQVAF